jgi:hypothetical protein
MGMNQFGRPTDRPATTMLDAFMVSISEGNGRFILLGLSVLAICAALSIIVFSQSQLSALDYGIWLTIAVTNVLFLYVLVSYKMPAHLIDQRLNL